MEITAQKFDYSLVNSETREFLRVKEILIKTRTNQTIIENGRDLLDSIEVEAKVGLNFEEVSVKPMEALTNIEEEEENLNSDSTDDSDSEGKEDVEEVKAEEVVEDGK